MGIHLDKSKATIGLESSFHDVPEILKQRDKVILRGVRRKISDVTSSLPLRGLLNDHIKALHAVSGEVMMSIRSGRRHSHGGHLSLLRHGRLALLIGPVATDGARSKPFTIHGAQSFLSVGAFTKGNKTVSTRTTSLHVPHDASFRDGSKCRKGLQENFIVHLIGEVAHKDVKVVRCILLVLVIGLVGPVDANLLRATSTINSEQTEDCRQCTPLNTYSLVDTPTVQGLHGSFSGTRIVVLNKSVVEALALKLSVVRN